MLITGTTDRARYGGAPSRAVSIFALAGMVAIGANAVRMAPAEAATYLVPTSIDPTGQVDVTARLAAFFESAPDGSTIQFPANARYLSNGSLVLTDRRNLTFEGNGATIFATPGTGDRERRHWTVRGGGGITFRNLVVKGANPVAGTSEAAYRSTMEAQHGFDFGGVDGVELDRVTVTDVYGDFV